MPFKQNEYFRTTRVAVILIFAVALISLTVLAGWVSGVFPLKSFFQGWNCMMVNAAICTLFSSVALILILRKNKIAWLFSALVFLISIVSLSEFIFTWDAGIDNLIFADHDTPADLYPGRMAPSTGLALLFTSISLFLFSSSWQRKKMLSDIFAVVVFVIGLIAFMGYLYNAKILYPVNSISYMSFPASLCLIFISLAMLFSKPGLGIMAFFDEQTKAAKVATRQILLIFAVLLLSGWFIRAGVGKKVYDEQFEIGMMVVVFIVSIFFIIRSGVGKLNFFEKEKDKLYNLKLKSEEFILDILSSLSSCVAVIDDDGKIIAVNKAWENFAKENGTTTLERVCKGTNYFEVCEKAAEAGDDIAREALKGIQSVIHDKAEKFELQYPCHSPGIKRWFLMRVMKLTSDDGMAVIAHNDITEIILSKQELKKSGENLRQVMDNSAEIIWSMDKEHRLITFNKAFKDEYTFFTGSAPQPGIIHYKSFGPEAEAYWKEKVDETLAGNVIRFERYYSIGSEEKFVEVSLYPIHHNHEITGVTCFVMNITERKKAELALLQSENYLRTIFETEPECIKILNEKGELLDMNAAGLAMIEADSLELVKNKPVLGIVYPEYQEAFSRLTETVFKGESGMLEFEIRGLKGTHRYLETHAVPLKDAEGKVTKLLSVTRDITERKKATIEKERLLYILQSSQNEIYIFDAATLQFEYVNGGALKNLGYSMETMSTMTPLDIKPEFTQETFREILKPLINREKEKIVFETVHKRADESLYPVEVHLQYITYDGQPVFMAIILDITRRREAEKALRESESKLKEVTSSLPGIVFQYTIGADRKIKFNFLSEGIHQYQDDKVEDIYDNSDLLFSKVHPEDIGKLLAAIEESNRRMSALTFMYRILTRDGKYIWMRSDSVPVLMEDGSIVRNGSLIDITAAKEVEEKLAQSETKLKEVTSLVPGVVYQYTVTPDGRMVFTFISEGIKNFEDESIEDFYKDSRLLFSKVHPEDMGRLMSAIAESNKKMEPLTIIYRSLIRGRKYIWVRSDSNPVLLADGTIVRTGNILDITETREAEERIRESEARFKSLVENIHEALIVEDTEGRLIYANSEFTKIFGFTEDEFRNLSFKDYTSPASYEEVLQRHNNRMKGLKTPEEFEYKALRKDGREIWIECRVSTLVQDGKIIGTQSLEKDITERKLAEEKIKESEEKYRTLMQQAGDLIVLFDSSGRIIEANESAEKLLGYNIEEYKNKLLKDFFPEEDLKENPLQLEALNIGGSTINRRRIRSKDGRILVVEIHSRKLPNGFFIGVGRDLTERIKAEEELRLSEQKYRRIVERNLAGIYQTTPEGKIITCNDAFARMLGYTIGQLHHQNAAILYFSKSDRIKFIEELLKTGEISNREIKLRHRDGSPVYMIENCYLQTNMSDKSRVIEGVVINITQRRSTEEELKISEQRFRSLIEQASDSIAITDKEGVILYVNYSFTKLLGYSEKELINRNGATLMDPEQLKTEPMRIDLLLQGKNLIRERRLVHKNGTIIDVEENVKMIPDGRFLAFFRDIRDRKKAQEEIQLSEKKYRSFFEQSADAIFIFDEKGNFLDINKVATRLLGYSVKELGKMSVHDIVFEKDMVNNPIRLDLLAAGESVIRQRTFKRKDGTPVEVEVHSKKLPDGKYLGVVRDVTERIRTEEKIREQEKRFRSLVDTAPDATVIVDEKGIIQIANQQAVKLLGYSKTEFIGMSVEMLLPKSSRPKHKTYRYEFTHSSKTRPMGRGRDLVVIRKDGLEIPVEISLSPFRTAEGVLVTASIRDITQRKKAEEELDESYLSVRRLTEHLQNIREEERTFIAREIHDELGQQLTVMMMDMSWLSRKVSPDNAEVKQKIGVLLSLLDKMVKTVRRISTELRPSVLDDLGLIAAMEMHLEDFEKRSGIKTKLAVPRSEPALDMTVKNGLFRIFQESLTNVARHSRAKHVSVSLKKDGNNIILTIADDGVGYDEGKVAGKKTLGVLGMRERAAMMGGEYIITGNKKKGTAITVKLAVK